MQAILPGRPQSKLQAVDIGVIDDQTILFYISGSTLVILDGPRSLLQTICHDDLGDQELLATTYCPSSRKIATASTNTVYIYALWEEIKGTLRWHYETTLQVSPVASDITCLAWGSDEELLVASDNLDLFSTHVPSGPTSPVASRPNTSNGSTKPTWRIPLASPVDFLALSPYASFVATVSRHDCFVKIWRRLSFESAEFEYSYLRHPATVTHIEWRVVSGEQSDEHDHVRDASDILYTICADGKLRVWSVDAARNLDMFGVLASIDMVSAIRPRRDSITPKGDHNRYAFILPWSMLSCLTGKNAPQSGALSQERHAQEYVKEIASRRPDVFVIMDSYGHMSAWGIENIGCKRRNSQPCLAEPFLISHVDDTPFGLGTGLDVLSRYSSFRGFVNSNVARSIGVIGHHYNGRICWQDTTLQDLCDPSVRPNRLRLKQTLTGHTSPITKIIRTGSARALISRATNNECVIWRRSEELRSTSSLERMSHMKLDRKIHRTVLLKDGSFVAFLHHDSICVWDCRPWRATELARAQYSIRGRPLCLMIVPTLDDGNIIHLVTVSSEMAAIAWRISLPVDESTEQSSNGHSLCQITSISCSALESLDEVKYFLTVDPAGAEHQIAEELDIYAQDIAISYTSAGTLRTYAAKVCRDDSIKDEVIKFVTTSTIETSVKEPAMASATSIHKAAVVDSNRTTLTIWDTKSGRLDHQEFFDHQSIQDLDWSSTPDKQSVLAVGFSHRVLIYTQLRYDYVTERPAWSRIKNINLRDMTPSPIGDSVWFTGGSLVIGAGNALFLVSNTVNSGNDLSSDLQNARPHRGATQLFDLVSGLNGPLPAFHPQFISQCVLAGRLDLAQHILLRFLKTLKFYTEGEPIHPLLDMPITSFVTDGDEVMTPAVDHDGPAGVTEAVVEGLTTLLTEKSIPQLNNAEQFSLVDIIQCVATVETHRRSIDDNAARFLLFWRMAIMRARQSSNSNAGAVSWREMVWAQHSVSQDIITDLISKHYNARTTWRDAQDSGMFMWLNDRAALLSQFEMLAKNAYTASEPKDPVACSLHYIALRKKAVLVGLWRMATWSREQPGTMKLLRNDFSDSRWKTAAAKNAYALMGKRRFEYAATFFLLADDLKSAVSVLYNQLGDSQLAIAVARVYGGDESFVFKELLQDKVLPLAVSTGNRWQALWAFWMLGQRSNAVRALVSPLHSLVTDTSISDTFIDVEQTKVAKSFLNDDPALAVAYRQLREKSMQTLKGAMMVHGNEEQRFVIKTASLLRRMGCDLLALDLVRNWEFLKPQISKRETEMETDTVGDLRGTAMVAQSSMLDDYTDVNPRQLLRRRSSLVVDDLPTSPITQKRAVASPKETRVPSMLDGFDMPASPTRQKAAVRSSQDRGIPSMLDGYDMPSQNVIEASTGSDISEQGQEKEDGEKSEKKHQGKLDSKNFKEPDPNSLLDAFGF